jgi:hypothetical protein
MTEPKRKPSGQLPSVVAFLRMLDSISDHEGTALDNLNERIGRLRRKSSPPGSDPRREGDEPIPVDVVELVPDTEPEKKEEAS